jgi:alkanesulfonate monooxygenase
MSGDLLAIAADTPSSTERTRESKMDAIKLNLIGTCPALGPNRSSGKEYLAAVAAAARLADEDGREAILIYTDHRQADPWMLAQYVIQNTTRIRPLIATQPIYMHPFSLAKGIASLAYFYGRQVYCNLVAGGFPRDLVSMGDTTPHDRRYDRVVEYATVVKELLSKGFSSFSGDFYNLKDLRLHALPPQLRPAFTMSGSSEAGFAAAKKVGARVIQYLRPSQEYADETFDAQLQYGTRLGIIVRDTSEEAWALARERFPVDTTGQSLRQLAVELTDSVWVKELDKEISVPVGHPYFLDAYRSRRSSCPFLVGNWDDVTTEVANYVRAGFRTFLLEEPTDAEDSKRLTLLFERAAERAQKASIPRS